jgi:hypothetical protein
VTESILESLSILSQLVILHNFGNKFYTIVSILTIKLVHARTQQWNFVKVSNQDSGKGNVNLDEMCVSYGNRGPPAVVNYILPNWLAFHAYGADINQNEEMCVEALQPLKSLCPFVDNNLKLVITCINAIASCFSRFEYSNSESLHLGRKAKVDVGWWITDISVLRIDNLRVITIMKCFGMCPKISGVSLVHCTGLVLARTLNRGIHLDCLKVICISQCIKS